MYTELEKERADPEFPTENPLLPASTSSDLVREQATGTELQGATHMEPTA